jgi:hypothetical protein
MKTILFVLVFLFAITLACADEVLFSNDFMSGMLPTGWTIQGPSLWGISYTWNAGMDEPELYYAADGSEYISRFISPAYDTSGCNELRFFFWHGLTTLGSELYTLKVQVSSDLANWTTVWTHAGSTEFYGEFANMTIPRAYLDTTTFHIALVIEGYLSVSWFIDNIQLNIVSRIATGTWTLDASPYNLYCDYIVPTGEMLTIEPGVEVIGSYGCGIESYGQIIAEGYPNAPILFTGDGNSGGWEGISIINPMADELRFGYCNFENCVKGSAESGGALKIITDWIPVTIYNCRFSFCQAGNAGVLYVEGSWMTNINNCLFENNLSSGAASAVYLKLNESLDFNACAFVNNQFIEGDNQAHVVIKAMMPNTHMSVNSLTFAQNYGGAAALRCEGEVISYAYFSSISLYNSIFWDPYMSGEIVFADAFSGGSTAYFNYCDIDPVKVSGATAVFSNCINTDPLFVAAWDCHLLGSSPCVNTGQVGAYDPDGTRKDMGAYPIYAKPVIVAANDVPWDQGRQVEVFWDRSGMDNTFMPGAYYSLWRGDTYRGTGGTIIESPLELGTLSDLSDIWWLDRNLAWHYIGQCPAYNFDTYALISPTLQDSCATGTNPALFRVVYQWEAGFATSWDVFGYSVDNIPPDPVRDLALRKLDGEMRLEWPPVTTGTYNGSSYLELNGIYYIIYGSGDPYFEVGPATYITTTTDTFNIVDHLTADRRFFRVVTSDQMP